MSTLLRPKLTTSSYSRHGGFAIIFVLCLTALVVSSSPAHGFVMHGTIRHGTTSTTLQRHLQVRPESSASAIHMMLHPNDIAIPHDPSSFCDALLLLLSSRESDNNGGGVSGLILPGLFLLSAIGAFLYANVVFTPEIIENTEQMRMETREEEVRKLIALVAAHCSENNNNNNNNNESSSLEEFRFPLEEAFGMTIEEYIVDVLQNPNSLISYANADRDLAELLKPMVRSGS